MRKFAVIDIGSNSVRLMFVADGKVLYKRLNTTRLGEGLASTACLKSEAIERSANAVKAFYDMAKIEGAEKVFAFATAAVRFAKNGNEFTESVKMLCGLNVEVISGEREAEIGITGALGNMDGAVIDIGGASTEIVARENGEMIYKKSVDIGVVRLKDMCADDLIKLKETAKTYAQQFGQVPNHLALYGIGGTATTLGALILGMQQYDSNQITGSVVSGKQMHEMADKLSKMSVEEIAVLPCVSKGRADVLTGGAVLLSVLMEELGFEKIIISDRDNLEGYAICKGWM